LQVHSPRVQRFKVVIFNNQFSIHFKYHESSLFPSKNRSVIDTSLPLFYKEIMTGDKKKGRRFAGLFFLGCLLFNFPILSLFNLKIMLFGIPLLYYYIFSTWLIVVALIYLIVKFSKDTTI